MVLTGNQNNIKALQTIFFFLIFSLNRSNKKTAEHNSIEKNYDDSFSKIDRTDLLY
jgi:hypothetical protein